MSEREKAFGLELYETPFRGYDPQLDRFWQVEPLADSYVGINVYQFAFNNPVSFNDPSGLCPDCNGDGNEENDARPDHQKDLDAFLHSLWGMLPNGFSGTLSGNNFMTMFSAFGSGSRITYSDGGFWIERGGVAAITQEDRDILLGFGVTPAETTSLAAGIITREFVGMGAFNYAAWSYQTESKIRSRMASAHSWFEKTFFTEEEMGEALSSVAMPVVEMTPNYALTNIIWGVTTGKTLKGNIMGGTDYAVDAVGLIPGEGVVAKGGLYLGKTAMAAVPFLVRGLKAADKIHKHHVLPQKFRQWFMNRGINNIDDYTILVSSNTHLKGLHGRGLGNLPGRWNQVWEDFITNNPSASPSEVFHFAEGLLQKYGLDRLPYVPYK